MKAEKYTPNKKAQVPSVLNSSQAKRVALERIGADARVWRGEPGKEPAWMVGRDLKPGRLVLGFGGDLQVALENAVSAHNG